jgi:CRP-like cAMP-binding protein
MIATRELLAEQPFLAGLSDARLDRLARCTRTTVLAAGHRVFREGGHADRFWLVRTGYVHLETHVPGRGDVIVETLGPGAVLGWSWLFPPYRWHFGAVAVEPTFVVEFDGTAVRRACEADPMLGYELTRRLVEVVVDRLQKTRLRLLDLYKAPA